VAVVQLLYFAALRDLAGTGAETFTLPPTVRTVNDLLSHLGERSAFRGKLTSTRVAINEQFCDAEAAISDGDTVALIPPVQGG
jgi:sulfur-carrier protein